MTTSTTSSRGTGTFPRGVHPADHKEFSQDSPLEVFPTPKQVTIPLVQHLGAPAEALRASPAWRRRVNEEVSLLCGRDSGRGDQVQTLRQAAGIQRQAGIRRSQGEVVF